MAVVYLVITEKWLTIAYHRADMSQCTQIFKIQYLFYHSAIEAWPQTRKS